MVDEVSTPSRTVIEGRSPEGGPATVVVAAPPDVGPWSALLYAPGAALLTRRQVVDLVAVLRALTGDQR